MTELVNRLIRPELVALKPYESARRLFSFAGNEKVGTEEMATDWLNANENPFVPKADIDTALFNRYPDFQPQPLIQAYARYAAVASDNVLATRGADESIELLIRTFCRSEQQDSIVICPPTYGMYAISAQTNGTKVKSVPLLPNMQLDLERLIPTISDSKLVFICSPNNPTGNIIEINNFRKLLEASKDLCLVVADEAYVEFCPEASVVSLLAEFPNLVITRTLSKAFGLAGLRCGFTLAHRDVIGAMKKVIAPYPISAPVAQIATQALSESGIDWMKDKVTSLNSLRDEFIERAKLWHAVEKVYPSQTNFVLLKLAQSLDASQVLDAFSRRGVLLRNQSKQLMLDNTLRVTIGDERQMQNVSTLFTQLDDQL